MQDGLADVSRPFWLWSVAKLGIEGKILALAPQPWRSVEATDVFTSLVYKWRREARKARATLAVSVDDKARILAEIEEPGAVVAEVARRARFP